MSSWCPRRTASAAAAAWPYVDDARIPATVGRVTGRWSHLFADSKPELHEFAAAIGLRRAWFQDRERTWHYDVTDSMRQRAIRAGARPVTWREAPAIMRARSDKANPVPARTAGRHDGTTSDPCQEVAGER